MGRKTHGMRQLAVRLRDDGRIAHRTRRALAKIQRGLTTQPLEHLHALAIGHLSQARQVIQAAEAGLHRTFITMAILTACRSGELLALSWGHVDLEGRKLRIRRSLSWDRTGEVSKPVFGPPKTDSSYRTLDLVPELVAVLSAWKLRSLFKGDDDLVFTTQTGGAIHLSYLGRGHRRALDACPGLPASPRMSCGIRARACCS